MIRIFQLKFSLLLLLFPWVSVSAAEDDTWEGRLIRGNIMISEWFDSAAEGIDLFLAGRRLTRRKNETNVRIQNSTYSTEAQAPQNLTSINANLRLPNVEEYWSLKFTSYDDEEETRSASRAYLRQTPREKKYGATVGLVKKLGDVRTSFLPRVDLADPLKVSHTIRLESLASFKTFEANPKIELYARSDKGTGIFLAMNFNFPLTKTYSFTLINDGDYEDRLRLLTVTNGFSLGQLLSDKTSFSYNLFFTSINRMNYHMEGYSLAVSWNHLLYKKILDYQITPRLDFARSRSFKGVAGATLDINFNF